MYRTRSSIGQPTGFSVYRLPLDRRWAAVPYAVDFIARKHPCNLGRPDPMIPTRMSTFSEGVGTALRLILNTLLAVFLKGELG